MEYLFVEIAKVMFVISIELVSLLNALNVVQLTKYQNSLKERL